MSKIVVVCQECGTKVEAWPSEGRRFCSRRCAGITGGRIRGAEMQAVAEYGPLANGYLNGPHGKHRHRIVAEEKLGRSLRDGEVVHHINGDRTDNRHENLEVFESQGAHMRHHLLTNLRGDKHPAAKRRKETA